jgi:phosphoribosylformimino-5-aminoimidazole carboxamide ribotide isomerase
VLDVRGRVVVRGVAGRRSEYRPIVSRLSASADPLVVARVFRERFGFTELYLADLNALAGAPPALDLYAALRSQGFTLWVDAGIRDAPTAGPLAASGVDYLVAGLETVCGPDVVGELCRQYGRERVVFSLDLRDGVPLGDPAAWRGRDQPLEIGVWAGEMGVRRIIVLDVGRVGTEQGLGTEDLCGRLAAACPRLEVIAGGGVRDRDDLRRLEAVGVRAALVASALHDGRLCPDELARP